MKYLLLFLLLLPLSLIGQVESQFNGTLNVFSGSRIGSTNTFTISGIFNSTTTSYTSSQSDTGDIVQVQSGARFYWLHIYSIASNAGGVITCNVRDSSSTLITFPLGKWSIFRPTTNLRLPLSPDGETNASRSSTFNTLALRVDEIQTAVASATNCEQTFTKASHGFRKGTPVFWNGSTYIRPTADSLVPDFVVVDSLTVNTFKVANCGTYTTSLANGLYWFTSASPGYSLTADTTKVPLFQVLNGKLILNPIVGFNLMSGSGSGDVTTQELADTAAAIRADFPMPDSSFILRDSSYGLPAFYTDIKIKGTYIYVCSPILGKVAIYDSAFPRDTIKTFIPNVSGTSYVPSVAKTQGNDLYVLCFDDYGTGGESRIFKYNITNPITPTLLWSRAMGGGYYPSDFAINDTLIYVLRISNVEVISSSNNNKGNFGPGGAPNSIQYKDGRLYFFGRRTYNVLDTAYFSVFNTATVVPTLVNRYKSALDSNYLGGHIDSDYIFLVSNSSTTVLRSLDLSLVKRNRLPSVNQNFYHFPYSKYRARVLKLNDYILVGSSASTYMYLFSYPEFTILAKQNLGENVMWFDTTGNILHAVLGDVSATAQQLVKGILNFKIL